MAYFLDNYPVPKESADIVLTEEQEKYCRIAYKLDDKGGAVFAGTLFANVIGSNDDPKIYNKSWLKLWVDFANGGRGNFSLKPINERWIAL